MPRSSASSLGGGSSIASSVTSMVSVNPGDRWYAVIQDGLFSVLSDCMQKDLPGLVSLFLFFIECIQWLSFLLDPSIGWGLTANSSAQTGLKVVAGFRVSASSMGWNGQIVLLGLGLAGLLLTVAVAGLELWRHTTFASSGKTAMRVLNLSLGVGMPLFYLPILHLFTSFVACNFSTETLFYFPSHPCWGTSGAILGAISIVGAVALIAVALFSSLFFGSCLPDQKDFFSRINFRAEFAFCIAKTITALISQLLLPISGTKFPWLLPVLVGTSVSVSSAGLLGWTIWRLPYYRRVANHLKSALFGAGLALGIFAIAQGPLKNSSTESTLLYAGLAVSAASGLVAAVTSIVRCHFAYKAISIPTSEGDDSRPGSASTSTTHREDFFATAWEPEIRTRFLFERKKELNKSMVSSHAAESVSITYEMALDQFPNNSFVHYSYAIFLLCATEDQTHTNAQLSKCSKSHPPLDLAYLISVVDKKRRAHITNTDHGLEEISHQLKRAMKYHTEAKHQMITFWKSLLKEGGKVDSAAITAIENAERKAETTYRQLLAAFANNTLVLRQYALFLEEIKNDPVAAAEVYASADSIEEEASRSKKGKRRRIRQSAKVHPMPDPEEEMDEGKKVMFRSSVVAIGPGKANQEGPKFPLSLEGGAGTASLLDVPVAKIVEKVKDRSQDDRVDAVPAVEKKKLGGSNLQRFRMYRQKIEQSKSKAVWRVAMAVRICLLLAFIDMVVVFASTQSLLKSLDNGYFALNGIGKCRFYSSSAACYSRSIQDAVRQDAVSLVIKNHSARARDRLSVYAPSLVQQVTLYGPMTYRDSSLKTGWFTNDLEVKTWTPLAGVEMVKTNLWDFSHSLAAKMTEVIQLPVNSTSGAIANMSSFRFLILNGPFAGLNGFEHVTELYVSWFKAFSSRIVLTMAILIPLSVIIFIATSVLLFVPSVRSIHHELAGVFKLFFEIPKSTIISIIDHLEVQDESAELDEADGGYLDNSGVLLGDADSISKAAPLSRKISLAFVGAMLLVGAFLLALFVISLNAGFTTTGFGEQVTISGSRRFLANKIRLYATELLFPDPNFAPRETVRDLLNESVQGLSTALNTLKFGDSSRGIPSWLTSDPLQKQLLYDWNCSKGMRDAGVLEKKCDGLDDAMNAYLEFATQFVSIPLESLSPSDPLVAELWSKIQAMESILLFPLLEESIALLASSTGGDLQKNISLLTAFFAIGVIAAVACFLFFIPLLSQAKEEQRRATKLFLMIPVEIIDSIPVLKNYLSSGVQASATAKLKEALEETTAKTRTLIEASTDAVVLADSIGTIEAFNEGAEKTFGWTVAEALGKNVKILMPDKYAVNHDFYLQRFNSDKQDRRPRGLMTELMGKRKDGTEFPIHLSLAKGIFNGHTVFAAFIRDVTFMKQQEEALKRETELTNKLLNNILPASISEKLKANPQALIADNYKNVTVLFADIVEFTKYSSGVSPHELVLFMNKIFTIYDNLVVRHKLEKIKTIGDCIMVASGCPIPNPDSARDMMEFAISQIAAIEKFDEENQMTVRIRVGMNTGDVTGGVIGTIKVTFDMWGDAVNVASRMESNGAPMRIQCSQTTYDRVKDLYEFEEHELHNVKGKGDMTAYLFVRRKVEVSALVRERSDILITESVNMAKLDTSQHSFLVGSHINPPISKIASDSEVPLQFPIKASSSSQEEEEPPQKPELGLKPKQVTIGGRQESFMVDLEELRK